MKFSSVMLAASTSVGAAVTSHLPAINEWLRAGSSVVAITAGLFTIALGVRRWKNKSKD